MAPTACTPSVTVRLGARLLVSSPRSRRRRRRRQKHRTSLVRQRLVLDRLRSLLPRMRRRTRRLFAVLLRRLRNPSPSDGSAASDAEGSEGVAVPSRARFTKPMRPCSMVRSAISQRKVTVGTITSLRSCGISSKGHIGRCFEGASCKHDSTEDGCEKYYTPSEIATMRPKPASDLLLQRNITSGLDCRRFQGIRPPKICESPVLPENL